MNFADIKINENIKKSLNELNFIKTTEIQSEAIPFLLKNKKDLIALAQTGTGKTAAFGIPIVNQIISEENHTQSIILCPTRELCIQITSKITHNESKTMQKHKKDKRIRYHRAIFEKWN